LPGKGSQSIRYTPLTRSITQIINLTYWKPFNTCDTLVLDHSLVSPHVVFMACSGGYIFLVYRYLYIII
jgi:hypothetical protein